MTQFTFDVQSPVIDNDIQAILQESLDWSFFAGKTVLVTGASGMLAAYFVEALMRIGTCKDIAPARVIALVRNERKAQCRFKKYLRSENFKILAQDVCEKLVLREAVQIIFHAASIPRPDPTMPATVLMPNILGTIELLEFAKAQRKGIEQFIFVSSAEVYGYPIPNAPPITENSFYPLSPTDIRSCYAEGKRAGEALCVAFMRQHGIPVKIIRPFHSYGPGMNLNNDPRVFASLISHIVGGSDIVISSDGSARRCFCYVTDAIAAFFHIATKGTPGESFNVGNDEMELSVFELANMLIESYSQKHLKIVSSQTNPQNRYCPSRVSKFKPDLTKLRRLGWEPRVSARDGFIRTASCYKEDRK